MKSLLNFLLILLSISLTANTCNREEIEMRKIIDIYWQHSYEDDKGDTIAFRPKEYDFPPSRGREGFEFKENGLFYKYMIAPADGIVTVQGSWKKLEEKNTFFIQLNDNSEYDYPLPADYKLHIVGYDQEENILRIKRS